MPTTLAVIGGEIVGAATADHLAAFGAKRLLLEHGAFGTEASGRNAGTLNVIKECSWAGYDGSSLDGQPVLDGVPGYPGLFISTGASTGFSDGPTLGELGARMLLGLPTCYDLGVFSLSRFAAGPVV